MYSLKDLTEEQVKLLPSEKDIQIYEDLGWYVSPVILPSTLLDNGLQGMEDFYQGKIDYPNNAKIVGPANDRYDESRVLMNNEYVSLQKKEIRDIIFSPVVAAIAARLSRSKEIRLFADALMCKFPAKKHDSGAFGWHTDKAYWPSCTSDDMLTAWVPLQDTTIDMGPMYVIEKSHLWEMDDKLRRFCAAGNKNLNEFEEYLESSGKEYKLIPMSIKKGQLSFHNANAFHGSPANLSSTKRASVTIHMQDQKNNYSAAFSRSGEKIIIGYERMCRKNERGDPDYRDPLFFPVLWQE